MKLISWEKINNNPPEEPDEPQELPGILMGQIGNMSSNVNQYDDFDFWVAHTNFYITEQIALWLEKSVEGLEALDILSPYRFRIAVGKLFIPQDVLDSIEEHLTQE